MGSSDTPAGWYPDPAGSGRDRWWDGGGWTGQVRDATPAASAAAAADPVVHAAPDGPAATSTSAHPASVPTPAAEAVTAPTQLAVEQPARTAVQRLVLPALFMLVLTATGIIIGLWLADRDGDDPVPVADEASSTDDPAGEDAGVLDADAGGVDETDLTDDAEPSPAPDSGEQDSGEQQQVAPPPDAEPQPQPDQEEVLRVDFDGVCEVWLTPTELETQTVRPWEFPAQCPTAPVSLVGVDERWIVVVASLNGADFSFEGALSRAAGENLHRQVLWSSHYPSLNPDLWVVFDGPFPSQAAASDAATRRGGGSYPRVLSDDAGDRYCLDLVANCAGERRN